MLNEGSIEFTLLFSVSQYFPLYPCKVKIKFRKASALETTKIEPSNILKAFLLYNISFPMHSEVESTKEANEQRHLNCTKCGLFTANIIM